MFCTLDSCAETRDRANVAQASFQAFRKRQPDAADRNRATGLLQEGPETPEMRRRRIATANLQVHPCSQVPCPGLTSGQEPFCYLRSSRGAWRVADNGLGNPGDCYALRQSEGDWRC